MTRRGGAALPPGSADEDRPRAAKAAQRALARQQALGWRTTDADEIGRRLRRATEEAMGIENLEPTEAFFGTFAVTTEGSLAPYRVEIRSLEDRNNSCTCPDFRVNGLGTCKHVEAVLLRLRTKPRLFEAAAAAGSPKVEIVLRREGAPEVRAVMPPRPRLAQRRFALSFFDGSGRLRGAPEDSVPVLCRALGRLGPRARDGVRVSFEVVDWADECRRRASREANRRAFEEDVARGRATCDVVRHPLYPYQREGTLHLAFGERVMLADDMGLGKTAQAIAACTLLRQRKGVERVLVVSPASLKTEWEEQIRKFTDLPARMVLGPKHERAKAYREPSFFYLANYEQVVRDVREMNELLAPDVVILDEAQRIKNWSTKTAQAVKRLSSPYAFVLTGTPLENRIDEVYSIIEFLDPQVFGPLFRFNREFYVLDERGRPTGYANLDELRRRIRPLMLRRRKDEVEEQLPGRIDNNYFVEMSPAQRGPYEEYQAKVARLVALAERRPLTREEQEMLLKALSCMRMLCDTTFILDPKTRVSPKLEELERVFEDVGVRNGRKALVFSEWERMLLLVRDLAEELGLGYAWHTGSVPQGTRRTEINRFKNDPDCRLFLSTDSGGLGLNLQAASVVVNLDLPWNPARLEQRIARAWRKHQRAPVQVVNLITSGSIEHRMLGTLAAKRDLSEGVIDGRGELSALKIVSSHESFLSRLKLVMGEKAPAEAREAATLAAGRAAEPGGEATPLQRFTHELLAALSDRVQLVRSGSSEGEGEGVLVVVDRGAEQMAGIVRRLFGQTVGGRGDTVEVIDRGTFETIERLASRGIVSLPGRGGADLHRSPGLPRREPSPEAQRLDRARELSAEAGRKARMARVLDQAGFAREALAPLREGVESALRALAVLGGDQVAGEKTEAVAADVIHGRIVAAGLLEPAAAAWVSSLRELCARDGVAVQTTVDLLAAGEGLVEKAQAAVARSGLGG